MDPEKVTYFGETDSRGNRVKFGIKAKDRTKHVYAIGKTGMGKSNLLEVMAIQDIQNGEGIIFIDPHGKSADLLLNFVPPERIKDVIYFAPFDIENPISFNVMEDVGPDKRHLVVSGLMSAFKKLFGEESFSDRMQHILQNTILALLEYPGATMLGINRMFSDKVYRNKVVANVTDVSVKAYWTQEFAAYTERFAAEATPAIQNKIGQFTSNPLIRNIVGQQKSSFDFRKVMDEQKIMIVNLSKGRVGEANADLLGSMLITKVYLAAMSRADVHERVLKNLPNFYLYVDEFQSFANESFADILSEARKYKLNLTIAHQYIEQMTEEVTAAVFGNVGTMITFRVGAYDAEVLEKEFAPQFTAEDLVNLGLFQMYLKLMIDGVGSAPFSATGIPPFPEPVISYRSEIIESSRMNYSKPRDVVERIIKEWFEEGKPIGKNSSNNKSGLNGSVNNKSNQSSLRPKASAERFEQKKSAPIEIKEPKKEIDTKPIIDSDIPPIEDTPDDDFLPLKELAKRLNEKNCGQDALHTRERVVEPRNNGAKQKIGHAKPMSQENLSSLRSALEAVMRKPEVSEKKETSTHDQKSESIHTTEKTEDKTQKSEKINDTKEIPEEDLKKILGI